MVVLIIGALAVIALLTWGCIILYRVTEHPIMSGDPEIAPVTQPVKRSTTVTAPKAQSPATTSKLRSTGEKVPPLYVD